MNLILIFIGLFILGTIFGSFGSVLVTRLADGVDKKTLKGIFFGFSRCPQCKHRLKAKNLIPLVSYFLQKGRCDYCHKGIAKLYPTLEILSGLVFILTFWLSLSMGWETGMLIFWLIMNRLFLLMIIYDFQKYELHVPLWIVALCVSLVPQFFLRFGGYERAFLGSLLLGGACLAIYYGSKWYVQKVYNVRKVHKVIRSDLRTGGPSTLETPLESGFGNGDVMLGFLLGTLLPFVFIVQDISFSLIHVLEIIILFFILSSVLGLLGYGLFFVLKKLKLWDHSILPIDYKAEFVPFIPFMIFAYWILLFSGGYFISLVFLIG